MQKALLLALLLLSSTIGNAQEPLPQWCQFVSRTPSASQVSIQTDLHVRHSCEVPPHITLNFIPPGMLITAPGVTVTIRGPIRAPLTQIFAGYGRISFGTDSASTNSGNSSIDRVNPKWWGATSVAYQDNKTDSTAAFQASLDTNKSVFVPEGIFNITSIELK